jgi:hypothetical protein
MVEVMNLSHFKFDYLDIREHVSLSWKEMKYAVDNNLIDAESLVKHAVFVLDEGILGYDIVLELAILQDYEDASPYILKLIELEEEQDEEDIKAKWLYLVLWVLYKNRNEYDNALEIVEEVYSDFDYPPSISSFVRYMPSDEPDLGSYEANIERLYHKWEQYLLSEELKYK